MSKGLILWPLSVLSTCKIKTFRGLTVGLVQTIVTGFARCDQGLALPGSAISNGVDMIKRIPAPVWVALGAVLGAVSSEQLALICSGSSGGSILNQIPGIF